MSVLTSMDQTFNLLVRCLSVRWGYTKKFGEKFTRTPPVHFFFYNLLPIYASIRANMYIYVIFTGPKYINVWTELERF